MGIKTCETLGWVVAIAILLTVGAILTLHTTTQAEATDAVCHFDDELDAWELEVVSQKGFEAHIAHHPNDGWPGGAVPSDANSIFSEDCILVNSCFNPLFTHDYAAFVDECIDVCGLSKTTCAVAGFSCIACASSFGNNYCFLCAAYLRECTVELCIPSR